MKNSDSDCDCAGCHAFEKKNKSDVIRLLLVIFLFGAALAATLILINLWK